MTDLTAQLIEEEEGPSSPTAYHDSMGFLTIARGCLIDPRARAQGLCPAALAAQDAYDLEKAKLRAANLPGFAQANEVRQAVLTSMCFQLGDLHSWPGFKAALALGDYEQCADQMLYAEPPAPKPSAWVTQTPARAIRAAAMMRSGLWLNHQPSKETPHDNP